MIFNQNLDVWLDETGACLSPFSASGVAQTWQIKGESAAARDAAFDQPISLRTSSTYARMIKNTMG